MSSNEIDWDTVDEVEWGADDEIEMEFKSMQMGMQIEIQILCK